MPIKVKIKRYISTGNSLKFPQYDMNVWLSPTALNNLGILENLSRNPQFVKIECKLPINKFTFYAKVASLNSNNELEEGFIWIPSEIINKRIIFDRNTEVEISPVEIADTMVAESVTIRLVEKEVENWSEDEVSMAMQNYKTRNGIAFMQQLVFIKPRTKNVVVGEIESIYPRPESFTQLFQISKETKIFFEGLPKNQQKVIDFNQIGGLNAVIDKLREIIQIPITYPEHLSRFGIKPPKGMLMFGPPGNGKTMIAKAVALSMGASFISIEGPELMSKYVGVGEQRLREKFEEAETKGNSVIFIDEIDSIASIRSESSAEYQVSIVATLLNLMDGMKTNNVFVIGATNRINAIDPALRRPGRFDLEFEVPLPSTEGRLDILTKYVKLEKKELFDDNVTIKTLNKIADLTTGYSGADLSLLYREAAMIAVRKNVKIDKASGKLFEISKPEEYKISEKDFYEAMRHIVPTSMRDLDFVKNITPWEDLVAVEDIKNELEQLHIKLERYVDSENLLVRPSFSNFIISGIKGSGKRTIIQSFASHYGYELFNIDGTRMLSLGLADALKNIEKIFTKAKQIAPSVVLITNIGDPLNSNQYLEKIYSEISLLNKRLQLFVVLIIDGDESDAEKFIGYKKFGEIINICLPSSDKIRTITEKMFGSKISIDDYIGKPIAQIISEANESLI